MYYPHPLYSSPISRFYFTSLRFYSIFASPFYYCYYILDGLYPPFFFRFNYVFFYCTLSDIFLPISVSPLFNFSLLCFLLLMHTTCLFSSSNHITSSYICYFQNIFSSPPYLTLSPKRRIIKIFSLNLHISHLDH